MKWLCHLVFSFLQMTTQANRIFWVKYGDGSPMPIRTLYGASGVTLSPLEFVADLIRGNFLLT
jgi:hypothetical protein